MDTEDVVKVAVGAFLVGLFVQAYNDIKVEKKLKKQITLLKLQNETYRWYFKDGRELPYEEQKRLLNERNEFINIVKRLK